MALLPQFSQLLLPAIENELSTVVNRGFSVLTEPLRFMLAYHLGWEGEGAGKEAQGKRIRPLLVLLITAACGNSWENALPAAAAVELIHNFSLIHDDIQDQSELRRGRRTLWMNWGIAQAINAGDAMFSLAQLAISKLQKTTSSQVTCQASELLNQTCFKLTKGQFLDLSYASRQDVTLDDYWPMINGKTAALLATCAEMGALMGGASSEVQAFSRDFGLNLGLAFQVQDDLLGIWGQTEQIGKSNESDLASGKKSFPVLYGLSRNGQFARRWTSGPITPPEIPEVVEMLTNEGGLIFTQAEADRLTQQALKALDNIVQVPSNDAGKALVELAHSLLQRQS
jgi:geranylgeranyl diphosphate synthase type I